MTRDDILRMAREAGIAIDGDFYAYLAPIDTLERFAALVAAAEREGCAREVYKVLRTIQVADQAATAIRARGEQK
jgi:hypothetical protein